MDFSARFHEDGFVIVGQFLDSDELAEVDRQLDHYITDVVPRTKKGDVDYESGSDRISHLSSLDAYDPYWNNLLNRLRTLELLESFLGTGVEPLASEVFYKAAHVGSAAPPHQDNAYLHFDPPEAMAVWVALDKATVENGCVWYSKGSHKLGDMPHVHGDTPPFSKRVEQIPDPTRYPAVPAILKPGDAVIHQIGTVHWSERNNSDQDRRGLVLNYKGVNARVDEQAHANHMAYVQQLRAMDR